MTTALPFPYPWTTPPSSLSPVVQSLLAYLTKRDLCKLLSVNIAHDAAALPGEHEACEDALPGREGPAPVDQPGTAHAQVALND